MTDILAEPIIKKIDMAIPDSLYDLVDKFNHSGHEFYVVGGAVRDTLLNKAPKDYDVATSASPQEVVRVLAPFAKMAEIQGEASFAVARIIAYDGEEYEFAPFRIDRGSRFGGEAQLSSDKNKLSIKDDVMRRDLTINALFYRIPSRSERSEGKTGEVVDYVGGISDIENEIVRTVGNPEERFEEDRLRILRAFRFAGRTGGKISEETAEAIRKNPSLTQPSDAAVSEERIQDEVAKGIRTSLSPSGYMNMLKEYRLLDQIVPGLDTKRALSSSKNVSVQLATVLSGNDPASAHKVLMDRKFGNKVASAVRFMLSLENLSRDNLVELKKEISRIRKSSSDAIEDNDIMDFGVVIGKDFSKFLRFSHAPPVLSAKDLISQGVKPGPGLGEALRDAEISAYFDEREEETAPEEGLNSLAIYLYRKGLIKAAKEVSNLRSDYIGPDGLRDKSWYRTEDSKDWYYWKDSKTDLKNKPLNPDDALRELVNFAYESGIETLPSCEGHVLSDDEAKKTFNKLLKDKKKINNEGLELINTENKKERVTFKSSDYEIPFDDPKELIQERYSGYIGLKFDEKDLPEYIYEQISEIDENVNVKLEGKNLHIYVDSDSQEKQKELWKEITEIIKSEVETSKKEARMKCLKNLFKKANDSKEDSDLKNPEDVYALLKETPDPKVYLDNPMGSKKGFGDRKRKLPFDYGEFSDWINPADGMGWDIIIPPSNREQTNLVQVGIVKVNPDKKVWKEKANKKPPVGNDKIIVASNGNITEEDKWIIEDFFYDMWQFKEVIWFGETKKEARKKRISFFRTNLDYGERESRLKNDAKDYNSPREGKKRWSVKYKKDIDCSNPKGFSQKQYCKRKKRGGDYKE